MDIRHSVVDNVNYAQFSLHKRSSLLNTVLTSKMAMGSKFDNFDIIQAKYKHVRGHGIRVDFLVPQASFPGKRPVIVRFHGGGLVRTFTLHN